MLSTCWNVSDRKALQRHFPLSLLLIRRKEPKVPIFMGQVSGKGAQVVGAALQRAGLPKEGFGSSGGSWDPEWGQGHGATPAVPLLMGIMGRD